MYLRHKIGNVGENLAVKFLISNGYHILERNYRCKSGEIDIIAYEISTNELVFVEVKTRSNNKFGRPCESVKKSKQEHIKRVAKFYIYQKKIKNQNIRFDVIEVFSFNKLYNIEHIKQAFI